MNKRDEIWGNIAALVPNIIFGFSFLFSKTALQYAHPLIILSVRFTVAFLCLNILWLLRIIKLDFKHKKKGKLLLMAVCQPLLYFIFELYGINSTSSGVSGVIISLVPIAVIIISAAFLREKPTIRQIVFSLLSLSGLVFLSITSNNQNNNSFIGIVLLLAAVLCAAVFNILSRSESDKFTPVERTYMMFLVGAVGFNIISLSVLCKNYITELCSAAVSGGFWLSIGYLAIFSSVAAFLIYNFATTKISAIRAASYSNVITVVSVFAGVVILKESLSLLQLIFCILIIVGVYGANKQK